MKKFSVLFIIIAGIFWGCIGVFANILTDMGFNTSERTLIRLGFCAISLIIFNIRRLKIELKDLPMFLITGSVGVFGMCYTYYKSISISSLSLASVLLYTSPIMVTIMSAIFYKEKIDTKKVLCLIGAFAGIVLISGLDSKVSVTAMGLTFGLLSAFTYALYSICSKKILPKYGPLVVTTYATLIGAIIAFFACNPAELADKVVSSPNVLITIAAMAGTGIITAGIPHTLYTVGLNYVPASKASVLACIEPFTATLIGVIFYGDILGIASVIGMALIFASVCMLSYSPKAKN